MEIYVNRTIPFHHKASTGRHCLRVILSFDIFLEFILVGREQPDGGQGISSFVTEDVVVLDVTKLRNVLAGVDPVVSTTFGLQFESLFFVQVLHGDLVRVLLLGLTHAVSGRRIISEREKERERQET